MKPVAAVLFVLLVAGLAWLEFSPQDELLADLNPPQSELQDDALVPTNLSGAGTASALEAVLVREGVRAVQRFHEHARPSLQSLLSMTPKEKIRTPPHQCPEAYGAIQKQQQRALRVSQMSPEKRHPLSRLQRAIRARRRGPGPTNQQQEVLRS
ncbi:MAG: hypothetical protein ACI8X5_001370 [Planctomycetota bacterium]|jgi:hypothetical protein